MTSLTLKDLEPGDKFIHAKSKSKNPKRFIVKGSCMFNAGHGSSTRLCIDLSTKGTVSKSCRLEVRKIGESVYKEKMNQGFFKNPELRG